MRLARYVAWRLGPCASRSSPRPLVGSYRFSVCYNPHVDPLLVELQGLVEDAEHEGVRAVVVGAFALRTYLLQPEARITTDLDLLVSAPGRATMERILQRRGFHVYVKGPWLRGERPVGTPRIIDVAIDAIVDLASFEAYSIDPAAAEMRREAGGPLIPVPSLEDLLAQKLIAAREKDALDVLLIAMTLSPDRKRLAEAIAARDVEIPVHRGLLEVVAGARSGRLGQLWLERTGKTLPTGDVDAALAKLDALFGGHA